MPKFEVLVVLLPLAVLLLQWHAASATAAGSSAVASLVTSKGRRSLESRQLTEFAVRARVRVPAPVPSSRTHSGSPHTDGLIDYPLSSPQATPPSSPPPPSPPPPQAPASCKYEVRTQTGTKWTAGTDSTISVQFYNKTKDSVYMVLTKGGLDAGHLDQFTIQGKCITDICKMELFTDASGPLPCWYAEWVDVSVSTPTVSHEYNWNVNEWLPAHEWSSAGSLVRDDCHLF